MATLTQLEYLVAVSRTQHFGKAAKSCHVSQPSLSTQIQKLEEELNIIVFDRSKQPVKITKKGHEVIDQAKAILLEHKKLFQIRPKMGELSGKFRLGVIPTLSSYMIPLFIESFAKKYQKIELIVGEYKTEDLMQELIDDRLDAGLLVTPLHEAKITERKLFNEPFLVFASKKHEFSRRKTIKDSDLDGSSAWLLDEGHCFREQVIKVCSLKDQNKVLKNVHFASGHLETLINLIRTGDGYTLLPYLATTHLETHERESYLRPFTQPIPTREVSIVYSRNVLKRDIIEALETEILRSLPQELKDMQRKRYEVIEIK